MLRFALGRIARGVLALLVASIVVFGFARLGGSPADTMLPVNATPEQREDFIERMGLDRPIYVQYYSYAREAATANFGTSLRTGRAVSELVWTRLLNSARLATTAIGVTLLISIPLGVQAARRKGTRWDRAAMSIALLGQSIPSFFSGVVAIIIFAAWLEWLPTSGIGGWQHYVMPAVTMGWFTSAGVVRLLRSAMLEVLESEYIKLARIKGLDEFHVVWKHGLRNALIPVVTFVGFMYGILMAAAVATEVIFSWPGLGRLAFQATLWRDFPLLQFTVLVWATIIVALNLLVDMAYAVLDPRTRGRE